ATIRFVVTKCVDDAPAPQAVEHETGADLDLLQAAHAGAFITRHLRRANAVAVDEVVPDANARPERGDLAAREQQRLRVLAVLILAEAERREVEDVIVRLVDAQVLQGRL